MMGGSGGMMGSMMHLMGGNMLVSGSTPYNPNGSLVSLEQAMEIAKRYPALKIIPIWSLPIWKNGNSTSMINN